MVGDANNPLDKAMDKLYKDQSDDTTTANASLAQNANATTTTETEESQGKSADIQEHNAPAEDGAQNMSGNATNATNATNLTTEITDKLWILIVLKIVVGLMFRTLLQIHLAM